ncbi:MAG: SDR family NAD(P)-dependent oxidoreductase [Sandaracinaceae bacterium]
MTERAVVTGASRGLGRETARELARRGLHVVVSARNIDDAEREAKALRDAGHLASPLALDVTSADGIEAASSELEALDVIVCNAGIALDGFDADVVARTLAVNYTGATNVARALAPKVRRGGRIVMVSSGMGELASLPPRTRERLQAVENTEDADAVVRAFEAAVRAGVHERDGWPSSAYRVSKGALNVWTRCFADEQRARGVLVNAVCPGWVRTDMGGASASRSVAEGASGIVWAATLPPEGPTGGFFRDGHPIHF